MASYQIIFSGKQTKLLKNKLNMLASNPSKLNENVILKELFEIHMRAYRFSHQ